MRIERFAYTKYGTLGTLLLGDFSCYTIELPWKGNERRVSCIPTGIYPITRHKSPKFGDTIWIQDVPGRSEILIHVANSPKDILGCIGPGNDYGWWDERKELAVWNSSRTMKQLLAENTPEYLEILNWGPQYP